MISDKKTEGGLRDIYKSKRMYEIIFSTLFFFASSLPQPALAQVKSSQKPTSNQAETIKLGKMPKLPILINSGEIIKKYANTALKIENGKVILPQELLKSLSNYNFNQPLSFAIDPNTRRVEFHGQVLTFDTGATFFRRILINIISKMDDKTWSQISKLADNKGEIDLGYRIKIKVENNFPELDLTKFNFDGVTFKALSKYNKKYDYWNAVCGSAIIADNTKSSEILLTSAHCIKGDLDSYYLGDGSISIHGAKRISNKSIELVKANDILIVGVPTADNINLARQTVRTMFKNRQKARNEENPVVVFKTMMQRFNGVFQTLPYYLPATVSNYPNIYNANLSETDAKMYGPETRVSSNYLENYSFSSGNSGSPGFTRDGLIGTVSASDLEYTNDASNGVEPNLKEQVFDSIDMAELIAAEKHLDKLAQSPISASNEILSNEIELPAPFTQSNIISSVIDSLVYDFTAYNDDFQSDDEIKIRFLAMQFEKIILFQEFIEPTVAALVQQFVLQLEKLSDPEKLDYITNSIYARANKLKSSPKLSLVLGIVKQRLETKYPSLRSKILF